MNDVILVVVQPRRGQILDSAMTAIGAGLDLKRDTAARLVIGVVGFDATTVAAGLKTNGADDLVAVDLQDPGFDPEAHDAATRLLVADTGAGLVIFGHGVDAMGVAPAVAARQGWGLVTDVTGIQVVGGTVRVIRPSYGEQLLEELECPRDTLVLTVRAGAFTSRPGSGTPAQVRSLKAPTTSGRVHHVKWIDPDTDSVDITKAQLLVSVGRPIGGADNVARVDKLATAMGGMLAASRPVVDAGWAEPSRQVGQTGRTVKPKVYLALGISGAIQHIAGMSGSELVIAVNTDRSAPITSYAGYVVDIDLHELVTALESEVGL
jgi:electron transfer flavoprotein alpha subunit